MKNKIIEEDLKKIVNINLPWENFSGKNILITGAGGFIGNYLVEMFIYLNDNILSKKTNIFALVRNKEKAVEKFSSYLKRKDFNLLVQDLSFPFSFDCNLNYVIHAAGLGSPKYFGSDPIGTFSPNVLGTYYLLEIVKKMNLKCFFYISSGEVYGEMNKKQIPIKEDFFGYINPLEKRSCYAESKRMGETICSSYLIKYNVPIKIARPFHTYGPGFSLDDGRVYADFVSNVLHDKNIELKSDGKAVRTFCYIADAISGFFYIILKGEIGEAYNVSNEKSAVSIKDLAKKIIKISHKKRLKIEKSDNLPKGYIKSKISIHIPNTNKIKKLGWKPVFNLEKGFTRTINSFS